MESDLWESLADPQGSKEIASRLARGVLDDVLWATARLDRHGRDALWWTIGSFLTLALVTIWLVYTPDGAAMRASRWGWPLALVAHNLGFVVLIGLRTPVDLRLTTRLFGKLAISELVRRLMPATMAAAVVVVVSGLALALPAPDRLLANTMIQVKLALLTAALLNIWFLHAVTFRSVERWDTSEVCPRAARIGAVVSMTLWAAIGMATMLAPFWPVP